MERFEDIFKGFREILALVRREKLIFLLGWLVGLMLLGSFIFYFAEVNINDNVRTYGDALYWSVVSITTVGYGDIAPVSIAGRVSSSIMFLSFMAIMPLVGATVTSIYITSKIKGEAGLQKITCTNHILIVGWNNNGKNILQGLMDLGEKSPIVIVAEITAEYFEEIKDIYSGLKIQFVRGPVTSAAVLQRANVGRAKVAIVLVSYGVDSTTRSDENAVLVVLTLRELGPNLQIVAECFSSSYRGHLRRAGAERVIVSGELDGFMLMAAALSPGLDNSIKDALTFGHGSDLWTRPIPRDLVGQTFRDLSMFWLDTKGWILVGLIHTTKQLGIKDVLSGDEASIDEFIMRRFEISGRGMGGSQHLHYLNPGPDHILEEGDTAIVIYPAEAADA